jgi:ubiquinone biosynthesis protein UbiJ
MIDPTFRSGFDAALETAINAALKYDPGTRARLRKFDGKVLALDLSAPALHLYLLLDDGRVEIHNRWEGAVTTELSGSAISFVRLLRDADATPAKLGVTVVGSSAFLAELQAVLRELDIDWEEPLAQLIGDVPGHNVGNALRAASRWLRGNLSRAPRAAAEAVSEEWRFTPPKAQFEAFTDDLAELVLGTERLEARIQILRQKFSRHGEVK